MIKNITLHNFQSHRKTELEFSDGVNVIIGQSDSGKTSIIRALSWLVRNRPGGEAFRSTWGGKTEIKMMVDNKHIIRSKDKENTYQLEEIIFNAFGTDVPEEIIKLLNINNINLQNQLDVPFLLSSTPGDVAKHFNQIAHLDQIDSGLKTIQQWIRGIDQDIRSGESQVEQSKEELKKFDHLEKFEIDIEVLEEMQSDFLRKVNNALALKTIFESANKIQVDIDSKSEILTLEPLLNTILSWMTERKYVEESYEQLGSLKAELKHVEEDIKEHMYIVSAEGMVNNLLEMFKEKAELGDLSQSIQKLITNITNTEKRLENGSNKLKTLETEFEDNFPELCPLCGKPYKIRTV